MYLSLCRLALYIVRPEQSLLGDNNYIALAAGTNFNDVEYNGVCVLNGLTFTNAPESGEIRGLLFTTKHEPARSQIVITGHPNCVMYKRSYWNGNWKNWETVYDTSLLTNSTMLGQLASALGGVERSTSDLDDVPYGMFTTTTNKPLNRPEGIDSFFVGIVWRIYTTSKIQVIWGFDVNKSWMRCYTYADGWTTWVEL